MARLLHLIASSSLGVCPGTYIQPLALCLWLLLQVTDASEPLTA